MAITNTEIIKPKKYIIPSNDIRPGIIKNHITSRDNATAIAASTRILSKLSLLFISNSPSLTFITIPF